MSEVGDVAFSLNLSPGTAGNESMSSTILGVKSEPVDVETAEAGACECEGESCLLAWSDFLRKLSGGTCGRCIETGDEGRVDSPADSSRSRCEEYNQPTCLRQTEKKHFVPARDIYQEEQVSSLTVLHGTAFDP